MDILERIDNYLVEKYIPKGEEGYKTQKELDTEIRERKAVEMIEINKWAQKNNVDMTKRFPTAKEVPIKGFAVHMTNKEKKKRGLVTLEDELDYWISIEKRMAYWKKVHNAGEITQNHKKSGTKGRKWRMMHDEHGSVKSHIGRLKDKAKGKK
jgi:hypothetical protein